METQILVLAFLAITFLQSGYDKIKDWKGNVSWLNEHFKNSFFEGKVAFSLFIVLVLEIAGGVFCAAGSIQLYLSEGTETVIGYYGALLSCITLLFLLFGQRVAKDYDGARTIVIYFIPALFAVYLLAQ